MSRGKPTFDKIKAAILDYYAALDRGEQRSVAMAASFQRIETVMGLRYVKGATRCLFCDQARSFEHMIRTHPDEVARWKANKQEHEEGRGADIRRGNWG